MPRYRITAEVTVSCVTEVVAKDPETARVMAEQMADDVMVSEQGAPGAYDWSDGFFIESPDGSAGNFQVEEIEELEDDE